MFLLIGCSQKETAGTSQSSAPAPSPEKTATPAPTTKASATASSAAAPSSGASAEAAVEIQLETVGETMAYDKTTLTVPTGKKIHLTLKNNGHNALMPHNWVLVHTGTEAAVALAGVDKKDDGYMVEGPDLLAHTPLVLPQQSGDVTFTAPAPGDYPYICTVPGHYMLMKGVMTVTP